MHESSNPQFKRWEKGLSAVLADLKVVAEVAHDRKYSIRFKHNHPFFLIMFFRVLKLDTTNFYKEKCVKTPLFHVCNSDFGIILID